ncbi:MAG: tetratricopeptide repeat protein [candidate division Zixibacteria bacterium]|nr:tetratricopeptide repeat protein [candidate division Zixibacteria bacterium]
MARVSRLKAIGVGVVVCLLLAFGGCSVYFNTFFNARKSFNAAENARKGSRRSTAGQNDYQKAIEKALKVVENHPNSKYYDDAIYVLGVSYYYTQQYGKAERRFRELLANYPGSSFAKDANLYLAKAKLALGELDDAMVIFGQVLESDLSREFKSEAAMELGTYYTDEKEYADARRYFMAVRDSLGDKITALEAQTYLADGYFDLFQFQDALGAYLQLLGMQPDNSQKYHSIYRAALCSFRMQRISVGLGYLNQLAADPLYFDSLGILKLTMAGGYESDEELTQAEAIYEDVAATSEKKAWQSTAWYRLGLIYQFDYDQLDKAKECYDKAAEADRSSPFRSDAVMRSSDIGKLKTFARSTLDSTATQTAIDDAAYAQYQLAELYWLNLNKPDSAMVEMQYLVDSFATSFHAPQGLIALAQMVREQMNDNQRADSLLKTVVRQYPHSDFVPEALEALGLKGTAADTGYAAVYIDRAENYLINGENVDSAKAGYQYVVDNFPDSRYYLTAKFALIWLTDTYQSPGDSSVYYAYKEFADSFPNSELAGVARKQLGSGSRRSGPTTPRQRNQREADSTDTITHAADTSQQTNPEEDTSRSVDPMVAIYRGPNRDTLVELRLEPIEVLIPFEFPPEAAIGTQHDWQLYFQLLIDFSGKVVDYVLKSPSGIEEIDRRAKETVGSMRFDAMAVSNRVVDAGVGEKKTDEGYWFVYLYRVSRPEYLR